MRRVILRELSILNVTLDLSDDLLEEGIVREA